ncbi:hydrolase [Sideroxydans lithotrophicus]|uniref:Isochorismatase hydrolase n=1 Tax=Sideroxydans lithotrophicus (strain ES-1) TaxID=580332 RepID=D5CPN2_SIDLE|nr:hydrolase [Sideroxydans lithotrophicus]ADE13027.1 isochorismatase hydrolase [Sideroxydans lithotrophicus ES-1]
MSIQNKFMLEPEKAVLLVIDVQEKLCAAMDQAGLSQLTRNAGILLEAANELAIPVVFTEQYVKGLGPTLSELKNRAPAAPCHEKMTFSCCGNEAFVDRLEESGRTQLIVAGMETHVCVLQTVIELLEEGFNVHVVKDAVLSRSADNKQTAMEAMVLAGAVPTCTEAVVFQLLKIAGTASFKKLSKLVK